MQTNQIVSRLLNCCLPFMHKARWQALCDVSLAAVHGQALTLTALALGTGRVTHLRHRMKCVDRLLANPHLEQERIDTYRALAHEWLRDLPQVLIVVDWSSLSADLQWHWLRASVVVDGRSITLYEEAHPQDKLAAIAVHRRFIKQLATLLPPTSRPPIILSDAGFRSTWFRLIDAQGWYWVGRTRNRDFVRRGSGAWFAAKALYAKATTTPTDLGEYEAVRNFPFTCRFALVKKAPTGRKHRYPSGKEQRNATARKIAKRYQEPWLLTYSPGLAHLGAAAIVKFYGERMKIEQQFRDTKNLSLGMGLSQTKSQGKRRLQALLLIAHIAQLAKRLIGEAARACQLELQLLSNNIKNRKTISVMTLATRVIARPDLLRQLKEPWWQIQTLRRQAVAAVSAAVGAG
jgi:Transposase DDE domain